LEIYWNATYSVRFLCQNLDQASKDQFFSNVIAEVTGNNDLAKTHALRDEIFDDIRVPLAEYLMTTQFISFYASILNQHSKTKIMKWESGRKGKDSKWDS